MHYFSYVLIYINVIYIGNVDAQIQHHLAILCNDWFCEFLTHLSVMFYLHTYNFQLLYCRYNYHLAVMYAHKQSVKNVGVNLRAQDKLLDSELYKIQTEVLHLYIHTYIYIYMYMHMYILLI